MIHTTADCCRNNGAEVTYESTSTQTHTNAWGYTYEVVVQNDEFSCHTECEALCNSRPQCHYFSHSERWANCVLCSECDFTESGNAGYYTSWAKTGTWYSKGFLKSGDCSLYRNSKYNELTSNLHHIF